MKRLFTRHTAFYLVTAATLFFLAISLSFSAWWLIPTVLFGSLTALGIVDLTQTRHAIRRNYPVIGNLRFVLKFIRPDIRQYFFEDYTQQLPFSLAARSPVYQHAKRPNHNDRKTGGEGK